MAQRSAGIWSTLGPGRKRTIAVLLVTLMLTLLFIWGNSLLDREQSKQTSDYIEVYVRPVLHAVLRPFKTPQAIDSIDIRKLAHFAEFFVLGIQFAWLRFLLWPIRRFPVLFPVLLSLMAAGIDEALQFINRRGPSLTDVGIDWLGALSGMFIFWVISTLVLRLRRGKEAKNA